MIIIAIILGWYLIGIISTINFMRKDADVTLGDIPLLLYGGITGPTFLCIEMFQWMSQYDCNVPLPKFIKKIDENTVIFKKKTRL